MPLAAAPECDISLSLGRCPHEVDLPDLERAQKNIEESQHLGVQFASLVPLHIFGYVHNNQFN